METLRRNCFLDIFNTFEKWTVDWVAVYYDTIAKDKEGIHFSGCELQTLFGSNNSSLMIILYLPLVASRGDTSGGQAIAFTPTAMCQPLPIFHHTTLSLLRVKGHLLNGKVLVLLVCFSLQINKLSLTRTNNDIKQLLPKMSINMILNMWNYN